MGLFLGRGSGSGSSSPSTTVDFSLSIPANFTYSNSSASGIRTYRDSSGQLQTIATQIPRFHYVADITGTTQHGLLLEGSSTNKMTSRNANPTDGTGWTLSGDAAATLTVVTDPSGYLTAQKLTNVCTSGKMYKIDNSGGSTNALLTSVATAGVTTAQTLSLYGVASTGTFELTRSGGGTPEVLTVAAAAGFAQYALNSVPNATTDQMVIIVPSGSVMYFVLEQFETWNMKGDIDLNGNQTANPSSVIITNAGAITRQSDNLNDTSIATRSYFNTTNGFLVSKFMLLGMTNTDDQTPFILAKDTTLNDIYQLRIGTFPNKMIRSVVASGGTGQVATSVHQPPVGLVYNAGLGFKPGEITTICGPCQYLVASLTSPTSITRLDIGGRANTANHLFGILQSMTFFNYYAPLSTVLPLTVQAGSVAILSDGQSNGYNDTRSQDEDTNDGERSFLNWMNSVSPSTSNWLLQAATRGTALLQADAGATPNYWFNDITLAYDGIAFPRWQNVVTAWIQGGGTIIAGRTDQGESDSQGVINGTISNFSRWSNGWITMFSYMQSIITSLGHGFVPRFFRPIGRHNVTFDNYAGYQGIAEAINSLSTSGVQITPDKFDLAMYPADNLHLSAPSYGTAGSRDARFILKKLGYSISGFVDPPYIATAARSGTTVSGTFTLNAGTALSPTTGVQLFNFFDGAVDPNSGSNIPNTQIAVSNVTISGSTWSLTLASTPTSGIETLFFGFNDCKNMVVGDIPVDNSTIPLPVRRVHMLLPYTAPVVGDTQITWGDGTQVTWGDGTLATWSA